MRRFFGSFSIIFVASLALTGCNGKTLQPASKYNMDRDIYVGPDEDSLKLWEAIEDKGPDLPATFIKSPANNNCRVQKALGSGVTNVTAYEGDTARVPLFFIKKREYKIIDQPNPLIAFSMKRANMTDVIVTKTDKPVNLLLSTHDANLWVIHKVPEAEIKSINVISHEGAGVIAPGISPSKIKFIVPNSKNRKCRPSPKRGNKDDAGYKKWRSWVRSKIGRIEVDYDQEYRVEAVLVGPAPSQPIPPSPIGGTVVVDSSKFHDVFWGTKAEGEAKFPPPPENLKFHSIKIQ